MTGLTGLTSFKMMMLFGGVLSILCVCVYLCVQLCVSECAKSVCGGLKDKK